MMERNELNILVVDDDRYILKFIAVLFEREGYRITACDNAKEAISKLNQNHFDIILTDIMMPHMSGVELLEHVHKTYPEISVILMTAYPETEITIDAIKKGAFDFIIKPFKAEYLFHIIERAAEHIRLLNLEKSYKQVLEDAVEKRTRELIDSIIMVKGMSRDLIKRLTSVAEFRDVETGSHISRIGLYANKLAEALNMPEDFVDSISFASPMHDIGKIGIPDSILLKKDHLTPEEFEIMKAHTTLGGKMLSGSSNPLIELAASIALTHHERWDGSGYPRGLKGEAIPVESRIVLIADQYDALRSKRPYKHPLSHHEVMEIITKGDGRTMPEHFAPEALRAFIEVAPIFDEIFNINQDVAGREEKDKRIAVHT